MHEWANRRSRIYLYDPYTLNEQDTAFAQYDPDRITAERAAVIMADRGGRGRTQLLAWPRGRQ